MTEKSVADLKPDGTDFKVFDIQLPGFHVRVQPSGRKSYAVFYRNADGRQRTITLGRTDLLKAEHAREGAAASGGCAERR
ncbi:Arm DNA-binding domain-containing protein [Brevundimonas nasdae]|uniref:Arm DNA-binding domain-containing protein n=1 Tax=Brevundimonas nasdae TaxID=172043 RepID=UPI003D33CB52